MEDSQPWNTMSESTYLRWRLDVPLPIPMGDQECEHLCHHHTGVPAIALYAGNAREDLRDLALVVRDHSQTSERSPKRRRPHGGLVGAASARATAGVPRTNVSTDDPSAALAPARWDRPAALVF